MATVQFAPSAQSRVEPGEARCANREFDAALLALVAPSSALGRSCSDQEKAVRREMYDVRHTARMMRDAIDAPTPRLGELADLKGLLDRQLKRLGDAIDEMKTCRTENQAMSPERDEELENLREEAEALHRDGSRVSGALGFSRDMAIRAAGLTAGAGAVAAATAAPALVIPAAAGIVLNRMLGGSSGATP